MLFQTEQWVLELASRLLPAAQKRPLRIFEVGSGTGAITLALATRLPTTSVFHSLDVDGRAVELSRANLAKVAPAAAPRVSFAHGDVFDDGALPERFDVLVSNPPYVSTRDHAALGRSVRDWESPAALIGGDGDDALRSYRRIADILARRRRETVDAEDSPLVAVEIGAGQADAVEAILRASGAVARVERWHDDLGHVRCLLGYEGLSH